MAKDAIVSDELAQKFATEKDTPYLRWVRGEGLDIIPSNYVPSLHTVELKPWTRRSLFCSPPGCSAWTVETWRYWSLRSAKRSSRGSRKS